MPNDFDSEIAAGRPRNRDLGAREENLLNTAAALFLERGYSGTSLGLIAREAHVAVRTIYVKFGGKSGLLRALISRGRAHYSAHLTDLLTDTGPLLAALTEFGMSFLALISRPESIALQRMVIAESPSNPELGETFYHAGIGQTYALLAKFFERPEIRAQLRENIDLQQLPALLISCVVGDPMHRFLFTSEPSTDAIIQKALAARLDIFVCGILR